MCPGLLDLGDVLHHVAAHLQGKSLQNLRSACRALRHSAAILDQVTEACGALPEHAVDQSFLTRLGSLRSLTFSWCSSLSHLNHLSRLQRLEEVRLDFVLVADLAPLACLAGLRNVELVMVDQYVNVGQLSQLSSLRLIAMDTMPEVFSLTSLTRLQISDAQHVSCLPSLQQLHFVELGQGSVCTAADNVAQLLQQLPRLLELSLNGVRLAGLASLVRLTALHFTCPPDEVSLTELTALRFLTLTLYHESPLVCAPSVRVILLDVSEQLQTTLNAELPDLSTCHSLRHLLIRVGDQDFGFRMVLAANKLPPQTIRTSFQCGPSQLFPEFGLEACVQLQQLDAAAFRRLQDLECSAEEEYL